MSFRTDIEAITGSVSTILTEVNSYLVEGVKFVTKYVMKNPNMLDRLTSSSTLNGSATTLDMESVLGLSSVTRNDGTRDRVAVEILAENAGDYTDTNSIYYTSKLDPKFYIKNDTLNVIPVPTNSETATVQKISPDTSVANTDSDIDNFPKELERGVVLYSAQQVLRRYMNIRNETLTGLSSGLGSINPPSGSSIITDVTYSGPGSDDVGTAQASTVSSPTAVTAAGTINLGSPPAYNKQSTYALTAIESISALDLSGISAPSSSIGINQVTYSGPDNNAVGTMSDVAVGFNTSVASPDGANVGSAPTYSAPSISGGLANAPQINDLTISGNAPNTPDVTDITIGNMPNAPAYSVPTLSIDYTEPGDLGVDDYLTGEDVELAQLALEKVRMDISKYQADIQNQANEFNEKMAEHQAEVQKVLNQAEVESTESAQKLQKYAAQLEDYQIHINKQVQQYQQNTTKEIQIWQTTRATQLEQYQTDVQNQSVAFNSAVEKFRADNQSTLDKVQRDIQANIAKAQNDLSEATTDAQLAQDKQARQFAEKSERLIQNAIQGMTAVLRDNESKINQFNSLLGKYQSEINTKISEHQQNTNKEIAKAELLRTTELQSYTIKVQDELNEYNSQNSEYQIYIQAQLDKAQRDLQALISDAQNDLAAANATAELATNISTQNQAEKSARLIQNAINTMQAIVAKNAANVEKYSTDVAKYQAEVAEAVQDYTLSLQEVTQDYNWLKEQYAITTNDLLAFLQVYLPQQQLQEAANEIATND